MKIALCSSASFYEHLRQVGNDLEVGGHTATYPKFSGEGEERFVNDGTKKYLKWHKDLIDTHFKEIERSDAVLVVNDKKHGINGYIGTNVMMEITVAYYLGKKVFILNAVPKDNPVFDEVSAIEATVLNGSIGNLTA